ncbi:hypothetical protein AVEN_47891-1 [Araneus ventricosus]|uniref:Uncharacterized protein n=1 Tax=Araneus ventricosus TaxID=182803 RepID=A0A4Y2W181_ARAVE|nr:hypothetical protein AVEN_47891-1 [Araneus ventricosus]
MCPVGNGNKFQCLAEEKEILAEKTNPATISLKLQEKYNLIHQKVAEKFLGTENKILFGYFNIKCTSKENRLQILTLLNKKKAKYILNESCEDRPIKVVIKVQT